MRHMGLTSSLAFYLLYNQAIYLESLTLDFLSIRQMFKPHQVVERTNACKALNPGPGTVGNIPTLSSISSQCVLSKTILTMYGMSKFCLLYVFKFCF